MSDAPEKAINDAVSVLREVRDSLSGGGSRMPRRILKESIEMLERSNSGNAVDPRDMKRGWGRASSAARVMRVSGWFSRAERVDGTVNMLVDSHATHFLNREDSDP